MTSLSCRADVFNAECPSRRVLELLAEKWAVLLIDELASGPRRTAELRRRVGGISEKMLIQTLRKLQRSGFVDRVAYPEVPPRVEYRLTPLGASLSGTVRAFDDWVERNLARVQTAERAFDSAARGQPRGSARPDRPAIRQTARAGARQAAK